jgi:membrane-bound serine protease (ClpP class)
MRLKILLQILTFVSAVFSLRVLATPIEIRELSLLTVSSAITPATYDYLKQNFDNLPASSLIVLRLNTPGGLVSTTKDIITMVGRRGRPFVVWITPEGASASSAGAIVASAAHFIFMSPGTNLGAATPVGLGEDIKEGDGRRKALNDLTALVRSLSASRGRPAKPFESMISDAASFTADEALKLGIINGVVSSDKDLLGLVAGKTINLDGVPRTIALATPAVKAYEPSLGQRILAVLADPSTAYVLFLVGVALIYFEFQAPGGFIAGAVGLCFLILSGISFQVLPLDWGSLGLIVAGIFLLILEVFVVSYGILSVAGLVAFVMGSLFLFHGDSGYISVEYPVIFSSFAGVVLGVGAVVWYLYREEKRRPGREDFFLPTGAHGSVLTKLSAREYQVKVRGEIWRAVAEEELAVADPVTVTEVDPRTLVIKIKKDLTSP